ncbi:hypothetical protein BDN72DRAFT_274687 [Pluteus cervinus]|uniref:Uncharacterized protein n=1 Tax=Pluteus cervinus TaxID=181527 RepID=A0ACD3AFE8_9AGAR|nr:hypothetical protein BDN72DRAFT_274687 [Pluteus cervinus]
MSTLLMMFRWLLERLGRSVFMILLLLTTAMRNSGRRVCEDVNDLHSATTTMTMTSTSLPALRPASAGSSRRKFDIPLTLRATTNTGHCRLPTFWIVSRVPDLCQPTGPCLTRSFLVPIPRISLLVIFLQVFFRRTISFSRIGCTLERHPHSQRF